MKVMWLIQNLVPYHHARFDAFCRRKEYDGVLCQVTNRDSFNVLEFEASDTHYRLRTLFPGTAPENIRLSAIRKQLFKVIQEEKPDVLCVSGFGIDPGLAMLSAAVKFHLPAVMFSESNYFDAPRSVIMEYLKSLLIRICGAGLVGGFYQKEYLCGSGRMESDRVFLGHNVVDSSHFISTKPHDFSHPYFFACARMETKKNYLRMLQAYAEYCRCSPIIWPLKIAGDGYLRREIEQEICRLSLSNKVELLGAIPFSVLPPYYWNAGAFIHLSTVEQWGLVVNEAMAAGCPVLVSYRCGCSADLVRKGENGFLTDPFSIKDIAEKMRTMSTLSRERLQTMGKCSEEIIRDWGPDRFAEGLSFAVQVACRNPRHTKLPARLLLKFIEMKRG